MARSPSLARHRPLKRSQIEETISVKQPSKKPCRKPPSKPVPPPAKTKKSTISASKAAKTRTATKKTIAKTSTTRFILLSLIQGTVPVHEDISNNPSPQSTRENTSDPESTSEVITVPEPTPPPPPLPNVQLVIIFNINGKDIGERTIPIDVNLDFHAFEVQLLKLCRPKLPQGLSFASDGVNISYKRVYVTKAQEMKRINLNWKEFEDEQDYSGLVNDIRDSQTSKMTVIIRAYITVPKDDFDTQIGPTQASQRLVYSLLIRVDNRPLLGNKIKLSHPWCVMH